MERYDRMSESVASKPPKEDESSVASKPSTKQKEHELVTALRRVDPLLLFLTKRTGLASVALPTLRRILPAGYPADVLLQNLEALCDTGILQCTVVAIPTSGGAGGGDTTTATVNTTTTSATATLNFDSWDNTAVSIGFPPPPSLQETAQQVENRKGLGTLHASTKAAATRRLRALKRVLVVKEAAAAKHGSSKAVIGKEKCTDMVAGGDRDPGVDAGGVEEHDEPVLEKEERRARDAIQKVFGFTNNTNKSTEAIDKDALPNRIYPQQVSHAGSFPAQDSVYVELSDKALEQIPPALLGMFGLQHKISSSGGSMQGCRKLYRHQAAAIEAALSDQHVSICTGTGSGKSLAFLLPILTAAYNSDRTSLVMFPTKALAQDQLSKLTTLLSTNPDLATRIRPATLDGDCPHAARVDIAATANVILTNPDTLHAAILPSWRTLYTHMLSRIQYVVIDEAHVYEGIFGAHVAMILSRLVRVSIAAACHQSLQPRLPTFVAASATLPWPQQHFRLLCPISAQAPVAILTNKEDGSPRSEKHFFVWNPPILNSDGTCTGKVTYPCPNPKPGGNKAVSTSAGVAGLKRPRDEESTSAGVVVSPPASQADSALTVQPAFAANRKRRPVRRRHTEVTLHRRHAADETALLLARAVVSGVRCIAFCKSRNLVEWVFERALACLKNDPSTAHLTSKVESYRGGYSMVERRQIEQKLFQNELLGVVGTSALELGVDIGGIDLTLHCGYPSSYASLLQQAGRAGRGASRLDVPSCAVVVCFNSPSEQHIWRHPKALLGCGIATPNIIPVNHGLVQGHLLCASEEFPLTGPCPITVTQNLSAGEEQPGLLNDHDLFGGQGVYEEALAVLRSSRAVLSENIVVSSASGLTVYKAHAAMNKAWSRISIRSIEPVQYSVVDVSHPGQGGRMDAIHDERAVMDTLPYSRVFYHAHPGAIITHRGRKYKVLSMTRPPSSVTDTFDGSRASLNLAAFAKPTKDKYATRPLSNLHITVVKQMERAEILAKLPGTESTTGSTKPGDPVKESMPTGNVDCNFAGCGAVTVKRSVHGYTKLSLITRAELSRTELSLPPLEFDTFGLWINTEADRMSLLLGDSYGPGVHALSHAILAVAPLFAPGLVRSDLECDHSFFAPTRVMLFDERAGGSGSCERLWKSLFLPKSILDAAVELLEECSSCRRDSGYDGGCPACLHVSNCVKFNMHLSRSAGATIGKRVIERVQETDLYKQFAKAASDESTDQHAGQPDTPRRKARTKALQKAKEMRSARDRQFVVGRPSWPLDSDGTQFKQVYE